MVELEILKSLKDIVASSDNILIIVNSNHEYDQLVSASSLFLGLQQLGKNVSLLSPREVSAEDNSNISGLSELTTQLGNKNLVVSFDYQQEAIDKVSYHIGEESKKFYLTIKPNKGFKPLDASSVEFDYTGADADLIFLIGIHDFETLDHLYFGYEDLYKDTPLVFIHKFDPGLGGWVVDTSTNVCMGEAMISVLDNIGVSLTSEISTNLFGCLDKATKSFSSLTTTAETFDSAAKLIRAGARRTKKQITAVEENSNPIEPVELKPVESIEPIAVPVDVVEPDQPPEGSIDFVKNNNDNDEGLFEEVRDRIKKKTKNPGGLKHKPAGFRS